MTEIESRPGGGVLIACLLVVAVGLLAVGGVTGALGAAVAAAVPLMMAVGAFAGRPGVVRIQLDEDAVTIDPPGRTIPYADIVGLTAAGKPGADRFPMQVFDRRGPVYVPAALTLPSSDLFAFLVSRLSPTGDRDVPAALRGFRDEQDQKFGADKVFTFRARRTQPIREPSLLVPVALGGTIGCLFVALVGFVVPKAVADPYLIMGFMGVFAGLSFAFLGWVSGKASEPKDRTGAGLVIGPTGIALVQGELKGKMRWDEVTAIDHPPKSRGTLHRTSKNTGGVGLLVAGAYIVIHDHFDRPAVLIYERMKAYWGGGA